MSSSGDDDYKVGHSKPPKHTQFKKGQSGNPSGRGKRDRKVVDPNPLRAVLLENVVVTINGKKKVANDRGYGKKIGWHGGEWR
jgi:Family of unknown function (DUF5681)